LIAAFGKAAELAGNESRERIAACLEFRDRLLTGLAPLRPVINGDLAYSLPNIVNLSIPGTDAEAVMEAWQHLAAVSNGAACAAQFYTCSHVLSAMNLSEERKTSALRFSWCHLTPDPDFEAMVHAVREIQTTVAR